MRFSKNNYLQHRLIFIHPRTDSGKMSAGGAQNHIGGAADTALFNTRNYTKVVVQRGGLANLPCVIKWNPSATVRKYGECVC